ncbi:MAG: MmgE/PrpD family protein [Rhodospirillales bacterium]|nr:MmgE/PrpD family protein [Rhodospirillales bacterium]
MTLSRDLIRLIRGKPVGEDDLRRAALFVLDTIACAVGALHSEPARMLAAVAPPAAADTGRRAFYFGGLSHILEVDDLHRASVTHPGCVVIPAAWAIAEQRDLGGRALLTAVLAGYEAGARVGMAAGTAHYRIWHSTSTCGPFGSAMAAAQLLGLDETQTVWALGNAGTQSSGLWEFLSSGAMSKHLHTARAAESGVLAALLAQQGFTGPDTILEGERGFFKGLCPDPAPAALLAGPQGPWELARSSIKPWPCCRHTHPTIDAAIELHARLQGRPIARVQIGTYRAAMDICDRPDPHDPYSAKFSLQHCAAVALADGRVDQASFAASRRAAAAPLRARVALAISASIDRAYPDAWGTDLVVETVDGQTFRATREAAKGDPENPVSPADLVVKAAGLIADGANSRLDARALIDAILALPEDRPVRAINLFEAIAPAVPRPSA